MSQSKVRRKWDLTRGYYLKLPLKRFEVKGSGGFILLSGRIAPPIYFRDSLHLYSIQTSVRYSVTVLDFLDLDRADTGKAVPMSS